MFETAETRKLWIWKIDKFIFTMDQSTTLSSPTEEQETSKTSSEPTDVAHYVVTCHKPTSVSHVLRCSFLSADSTVSSQNWLKQEMFEFAPNFF